MVFESGRPIAHVVRDLGIHQEALRKWVRKTEADEGRRKDLLSSEEPQIKAPPTHPCTLLPHPIPSPTNKCPTPPSRSRPRASPANKPS